MTQPVVVTYLEMTSPDQLSSKNSPTSDADIRECCHKNFKINRFFYQYVGQDWQWLDKAPWTDEQWKSYAERKALHLFMLTWQGTPAGYFELEHHSDNSVEIMYFGLAKPYIGLGLGGYLLSQAIEKAWALNPNRVWVHTCSLDHPNALQNYEARGMKVYKTEVED